MKIIKSLIVLLVTLISFQFDISSQTWTKKPGVALAPNCGGYWEYLPVGYDPGNPTKVFPIIIFFHGASEAGTGSSEHLDRMVNTSSYAYLPDEDEQTALGLPSLINTGNFPATFKVGDADYAFIVVAPQCDYNASLDNLEQTVNYYLSNYNVDTRGVFLTGLSIGGTRTWIVGGTNSTMTSKFAAIVPVAGGADGNYRYCAPGTYPCDNHGQTTTGTMFNQVVANLAPSTSTTPKVAAVHGFNDVNKPYGTDYVENGIKVANPGNSAKLIIYSKINPDDPNEYAPWTGHESWIRAYKVSNTDFDGMNMYSWMISQSAALLPVTLTSFDAVAKNNAVDLVWNTASESNSSHFAVERSSNGREFKEIGRVNSSGNSTTAKNYKFTDNSPLSGYNYYRLKMVDLDATFKFSEVRRVSMNGSDLEFSFGPNPVINEANIRISGSQRTRLNITVTDLMGRTLKTMSFSKTDIIFSQKINLAELPAGQYVLSIKGDNVNYTQRIMKR